MFFTEFPFENIMSLPFFQTIFSAPYIKSLKMLNSLAFNGHAKIRNKEIQKHVTVINKPIEGLLFFKSDLITPKERTHFLFKMR